MPSGRATVCDAVSTQKFGASAPSDASVGASHASSTIIRRRPSRSASIGERQREHDAAPDDHPGEPLALLADAEVVGGEVDGLGEQRVHERGRHATPRPGGRARGRGVVRVGRVGPISVGGPFRSIGGAATARTGHGTTSRTTGCRAGRSWCRPPGHRRRRPFGGSRGTVPRPVRTRRSSTRWRRIRARPLVRRSARCEGCWPGRSRTSTTAGRLGGGT